jgi:hypothetical protein
MTESGQLTTTSLPPPDERPAVVAADGAATGAARAGLTPEQARLLPFYHDLRNEIVQPDKVVVSTQYFWARWAPRLGPTLTALVVCLRRHCYYNKITQERRDWCFPEQATLAREIGVESTKTIRAALQHPLAHHFIRREPRYTYDPKRGKKVRTSDMYYVAMDDPLTPDDEEIVVIRAAQRVQAANDEASATSRGPSGGARSTGQKGGQVGTVPGGKKDRQVGRSTGRNARQDSAANFSPEIVLSISTHTTTNSTQLSLDSVVQAFAEANNRPATPVEIARLGALCQQFERFAQQAQPPTSGSDWIIAAIREAVESGSQFVAPRRILRICERWAGEGQRAEENRASRAEERAALSVASGRGIDGTVEPRGPDVDEVPESPVEATGRSDTGVTPPGSLHGENAERSSEADDHAVRSTMPGAPPSFVVFPDLDLLSRPLWQAVCDEARRRLPSPVDHTLLHGSQLLAREQSLLIVGIRGRSAVQRAELRLAEPLSRVARAVVGRAVELRFVSLDEGG